MVNLGPYWHFWSFHVYIQMRNISVSKIIVLSSTSLETKLIYLKASQIESKIQIFAIEKRTALNKKLHQAFLNLKIILIYLRNGIATTVIDWSGMDNFSRELHISAGAGVKTDLLVLPFSREHEKTCLKQMVDFKDQSHKAK